MFQDKEAIEEVKFAIRECAKFIGAPILESELKDISKRLMRYYGADLFRVIYDIGQSSKFMPSGQEIERRVRIALGKDPAKGINEDLVERHKEELIKSGVSPEKAEKGAAFLKSIARSRRESAPSLPLDKHVKDESVPDNAVYIVAKPQFDIPFEDGFEEIEVPSKKPLADLEDFDS